MTVAAIMAGTVYTATVPSPIGPLTLTAQDGYLTGVHMAGQAHMPASAGWRPDPRPFAAATEQLDAYFAGELTDFDLPLRMAGTGFQVRVWEQLRQIPYGETWSYGALAAKVGNPKASRAVGLANGRNPVAIVVPCHRVIGASGALVGYGGGLDRKTFLLDHERQVLARRSAPA
jgi:methylated-DNA-[protein]-cysteine S-methyltransferase